MHYLGTFNHTLDAKGRLFVPARFREALGESFVLFKSPDRCLSIYDNENYDKLVEQVKMCSDTPAGRRSQSIFFRSSLSVSLDKQGRFTIPQDYISFASLETDVVLIGCSNRLEIWSKAEDDRRLAEMADVTAEDYPAIFY